MSLKKVFEQARRNKAARAADQAAQQGAQAGERPTGFSRTLSRIAGRPAGRNFSNPNMMADLAAQAQGNMRGRPMVEDIMVAEEAPVGTPMMRKGGKVKKMAKGGSTASKRGDGCATKGKTKGRFV
jgi:hypothetical protein